MFEIKFDSKKFSKDFEKQALSEMEKSLEKEIKKVRCKTHNKIATIKSFTNKGFDLNFCCESLQEKLQKKLK